MKRAVHRIGAVVLVAGAGALVGCSSSANTASIQSDNYYVVQTADGGFVVGDSMGMQMKATHDVAFAMAMADSYPDFDAVERLQPRIPTGPATRLADHPGD